MGDWHEIAHMPNYPQRGCADTVVSYRRADDGGFDIVNTCRKGSSLRSYRGHATPAPAGSRTRFRVAFFLFLRTHYVILDLDPDYRWAVVGDGGRGQLWIISREPAIDERLYREILARAAALGYDVTRLERTVLTGGSGDRRPPA